MESFRTTIKCLVASGFISVCATLCSADSSDQIRLLYNELAASDQEKFAAIEREIKQLWSLSGSPGVDLLYKRGENSFKAQRFDVAAQHFGAVIEMAPQFASGWYGRARAYHHLGYFGPAIEDLQAALRLDALHYLGPRDRCCVGKAEKFVTSGIFFRRSGETGWSVPALGRVGLGGGRFYYLSCSASHEVCLAVPTISGDHG